MPDNDRNQSSNAEKEPDRDSAPADRSGYPGGYGPAQGQREPIGDTNEGPKDSSRERSREH